MGINIPLKAYHYQIRVCDELYDQIKKDSRLNIINSTNFPLLSFVDKNGALIQYRKMHLEVREPAFIHEEMNGSYEIPKIRIDADIIIQSRFQM